jgi:hypothetical protein
MEREHGGEEGVREGGARAGRTVGGEVSNSAGDGLASYLSCSYSFSCSCDRMFWRRSSNS